MRYVSGSFPDREYRYHNRRLSRPNSNRLRTPYRLTRAPFADRGGNGEIVKIRTSLRGNCKLRRSGLVLASDSSPHPKSPQTESWTKSIFLVWDAIRHLRKPLHLRDGVAGE